MRERIADELKYHVPFTIFGAVTGIIIMLVIALADALTQVNQVSETVFYILHPLHVTLSAIVITSLYREVQTRKDLDGNICGLCHCCGHGNFERLPDSLSWRVGAQFA